MTRIDSRIRTSAILVSAGLIVAAISLMINHPLAFIMFVLVAGLLVGVGAFSFLYVLVSDAPRARFIDVK